MPLRDDLKDAVDKFEADLAFTAPELYPMCIEQLRGRLEDIAHQYEEHENDGEGDYDDISDD